MKKSQLELLVFDWDGTLVDSEAAIVTAMMNAITALGLAQRSHEDIRNIIGLGLSEAVNLLFPDMTPDRQQDLADSYRACYSNAAVNGTRLFPQTRETIRLLHEQGYLLAIATGKSRRGLDRSLKETGLEPYFHASRSADEAFSKPHPQMLEEIMDMLGILPHGTAMIGDSEYDLQMANNAGVAAIGVSYGVHDQERLLQYRPLICLQHINELYDWLNNDD